MPYDRPPLTKELFTRQEPLWLADDLGIDIDRLDLDIRVGTRVSSLRMPDDDASRAGSIALELVDAIGSGSESRSGEVIHTDSLIIATGASAVHPPAWTGAITLRTLDDAAALRDQLRPGTRLAIIGSGWLGSELASSAASAGCVVTVHEAGPDPLNGPVGAAIGDVVRGWMAEAGVGLVTEAAISGLIDPAELGADVAVAALGARPVTQWLWPADRPPSGERPQATPLGWEVSPSGHLVVDAGHRVHGAPPTVRAVGDCALRMSPRFGGIPGGHWDGALRDPERAVAELLGKPAKQDVAPYVFSLMFGHDLALYGVPSTKDRVDVEERDGGTIVRWFRGDTVSAIFTIDLPKEAARARKTFR